MSRKRASKKSQKSKSEKVNKKNDIEPEESTGQDEVEETGFVDKVIGNMEMSQQNLDFIEESQEGDIADEESLDLSPPENTKGVDFHSQDNDANPWLADEDVEKMLLEDGEDPEVQKLNGEEGTPSLLEEDSGEAQGFENVETQGESLEFSSNEELEDLPLAGMEESHHAFVDEDQLISILESALFSHERPLGMGILKALFKGTNIGSKEIRRGLETYQSQLAASQRGVTLEAVAGGWQLRTKVDNLEFLQKLGKTKPFKLSGPALEVLSIVAYKQPIVKSEVDHIRGVESGHLVRALMDKGLVLFQGKSDLPGKPMQYGTTRKFLEIFGLRNLKELPTLDEIDQLLPDGIGDDEESPHLSQITDSLSETYVGNYSEGEEELEKISGKLSDIDTSSEFFEEEKRRQREKRDRDRARDLREQLDVIEEISDKDRRWLDRYEADQKAKAELEAQASSDTSSAEVEEGPLEEEQVKEGALGDSLGDAESIVEESQALASENNEELVSESLETNSSPSELDSF